MGFFTGCLVGSMLSSDSHTTIKKSSSDEIPLFITLEDREIEYKHRFFDEDVAYLGDTNEVVIPVSKIEKIYKYDGIDKVTVVETDSNYYHVAGSVSDTKKHIEKTIDEFIKKVKNAT